jgi:membrane-associated phospholipid phosphatase
VEDGAFWGWPGWRLLGHALLLGAALTLWWILVYHGADWLTARYDWRVRIHLDIELGIPFVPAAVLLYLSINLLFGMAPFVLRSRREVDGLALTLAAVIVVAGVGFLLVPAEAAFPPVGTHAEREVLGALLVFAKRVALRYNMVPSLHVALGAACALAYATRAGTVGKVLLGTWTAGIAASTLLIHQHHLIDVATGLALAWGGHHFIYERWLRTGRTLATSPAASPGPPA